MDNEKITFKIKIGSLILTPMTHAIILIVLWTILRYILFGILGYSWFGISHDRMKVYPTFEYFGFLVLVFGTGSVGLIYFGLIKFARMDAKSIGWSFDHFGRNFALGIAGFFSGLVILLPFFFIGDVSELTLVSHLNIDIWELILAIFLGFAIAAWIEQSLLLGYLQPLLIEKYGYWMGIFLQALTWPLSHIGWFTTWQDFLMGFLFGLLFGVLKGRNNTLIPGALAHGSYWVLIVITTV